VDVVRHGRADTQLMARSAFGERHPDDYEFFLASTQWVMASRSSEQTIVRRFTRLPHVEAAAGRKGSSCQLDPHDGHVDQPVKTMHTVSSSRH